MRGQARLLVGVFVAALAVGLALSLSRPPDHGVTSTLGPSATEPSVETTAAPVASSVASPTAMTSATPSPLMTEVVATATSTATPTEAATPTLSETATNIPAPPTSPPLTTVPTRSSGAARFVIGGVDFSSVAQPLTMSYPTDWERANWLMLENVGILLSDVTGESLRVFDDIGSWRPGHRIFVYADTPTGVPILSIHDGYWSRQPLEAEPLRAMIEGAVGAPFALSSIQANLERLRGHPMLFGQAEREARFTVRNAVRMDANTTSAYLYRPAHLSELFPEGEVTGDTLMILICSTRQPDEPDEVFPARFLILLALDAS